MEYWDGMMGRQPPMNANSRRFGKASNPYGVLKAERNGAFALAYAGGILSQPERNRISPGWNACNPVRNAFSLVRNSSSPVRYFFSLVRNPTSPVRSAFSLVKYASAPVIYGILQRCESSND